MCGSDRVTYSNECTFGNAVCKDPVLTKRYDGTCSKSWGFLKRQERVQLTFRTLAVDRSKTLNNQPFFSRDGVPRV